MDATELEHAHLRSALEFAVAIAAEGSKRRPPLSFPDGLRPYLRAPRLNAAALGPVRRAIEGDDDFRAKLGIAAVPELVDGVGRLWLQRPPGWEDRVRALLAEADAARAAGEAENEARRERKRREAAEQVAARTRAELVGVHDRLASVMAELDHLRATVTKLEDLNAEVRADLVDARNELRHANDRITAAAARAARAVSERDEARTELRASLAVRDEVLRRRTEAVVEAAALAEAAAAARDLAVQLENLASPVEPTTGRRERMRRQAIAIPGSVAGDPQSTARFLLRSGASVLVDGYNVAILGWPDLALADQRRVLLDTAENAAKRFGSDITVVFDGADVVGATADHRRVVRVVFSPDDVIADDVIRAEVARLPSSRPVVVVTDDAAIVADVRQMGANTVSSGSFLAVTRV